MVTGAASGIGRAVVERMLADGVSVLAVDLNDEELQPLGAQGADVLAADLAGPDGREAVIEAARGCDYLVNSAGIIELTPIHEVTVAEWRRILTVNAEAVFFLVQGIAPTMPPGSAIVNVSSTSAKTGTTLEAAVYAASKAAVLSLTRSFARWLADGPVRVNAIVPGIVDTPMQDRVLEQIAAARGISRQALDEARLSGVWLGRAATAAECAGVICFLLSDEAAYMTGQGVNFSGGLVTW